MKNIFNATSIALIALVLLKQTALAADISAELLLEKSLPASNKFIESVNWPQEREKLGFKSLSLGDTFNLEDKGIVHAYTNERDAVSMSGTTEPFTCKFTGLAPLFICKMRLYNNPKFPQTLQDMTSAFGNSVELELTVLLQRAIGKTEINNKKYGSGRIVNITITNERPSRDFVARATSYFSEKFNSQPTVRTIYKNPTEVYSKICIESKKRIENKAASELSLKDQNDLKKCEEEATLVILSGKATSGRRTGYTWKPSEGRANVTITSSESNISIGGSTPQILSNSVQIKIELNLNNAGDIWLEDIKKVRMQHAAESGNKSKSDF
jgi:hypothetical protein